MESQMDHKHGPPQHQVFINFRGDQLRNNFISHLVKALKGKGINVFIDTYEEKGEDIKILFKRIEESRVALAIFSTRYTESKWCLDELVKIKERVDLGMIKVRNSSSSFCMFFLHLHFDCKRTYILIYLSMRRYFLSSTRCLQKVWNNLWESLVTISGVENGIIGMSNPKSMDGKRPWSVSLVSLALH